jgi:hypothetical protein
VKALLSILGLSVLHFVAAVGVFIYVWNPGDGTNQMPSLLDRACYTAWDILWCPFQQIAGAAHIGAPGLAEVLLFVASSLVWGILLYAAIVGIRRLCHIRFRHDTIV